MVLVREDNSNAYYGAPTIFLLGHSYVRRLPKDLFIQDTHFNFVVYSTPLLQGLIDEVPLLIENHGVPSAVLVISGGNDCINLPDYRDVCDLITVSSLFIQPQVIQNSRYP